MILLKILNEKMKKVLFFMFLLFLGLGTASVKAQVRIGGNTAPNASALLDLNATDATNNGTKGLALPRVNLTSNTMLLSGVTANLTGMMVYNTTATLGAVGIYFWNGATWVRASLPSTSAADSGKFLYFNGVTWTTRAFYWAITDTTAATVSAWPQNSVSWQKVLDTTISFAIPQSTHARIHGTGFLPGDKCFVINNAGISCSVFATMLAVWYSLNDVPVTYGPKRIVVVRPAL